MADDELRAAMLEFGRVVRDSIEQIGEAWSAVEASLGGPAVGLVNPDPAYAKLGPAPDDVDALAREYLVEDPGPISFRWRGPGRG